MQLFVWIRRYDLGMDIAFDIGTFCRKKSIDVIRTQDTMCSVVMIEFIFALNPICFLIAFSNDRADFFCQRL